MAFPGIPAPYVGQVERDADGILLAVLSCGDDVISREQVKSVRQRRLRITDMALAAADA